MKYAFIAIVNVGDQADDKGTENFILHKGRTIIIDAKTGLPKEISADDYLDLKFEFAVGKVPICPLCFEEVFHVNREGERTTYFSHYPMTDNSPECPFRVKYNPRKSLYEISVAVKSMPYLIYFEKALNHYFERDPHFTINSAHKKLIVDICKSMKDNWYKNRIITIASNFESLKEMYNIFTMFAPLVIKLEPELANLKTSYLLDKQRESSFFVWECLHFPRERPNLEFLMKLTLEFLMTKGILLSDEVEDIRQAIIFWAFGLLSIVPWSIYLKRDTKL